MAGTAAVVVAGVGAVHAVHVYGDCFYGPGAVGSVDHAGAFGPEVACRCRTVVVVVVVVRRRHRTARDDAR